MIATIDRRLRILSVASRPLRLQEVLLGVRSDVAEQGPRAAEEPASLCSFLEAAAVLQTRVAAALERAGLDPAAHEILEELRSSGGSLDWSALGGSRRPSEVRAVLDGLARRGLVRVLDGFAELTALGRAMAVEGATQVEVVRARFAAALTVSERAQLGRLLGKLESSEAASEQEPLVEEWREAWRG